MALEQASYRLGCLEACLEYEAREPEKKLQQWEQFGSSLAIFHPLISSRTRGVSEPSCQLQERTSAEGPAGGFVPGDAHFLKGKPPSFPW